MTTAHSPDELERLYATRFEGRDEYRDQVWRVLAKTWFDRYVPEQAATALDLGCGHGELIRNISADRRIGMDLNPAAKALQSDDIAVLLHDCSEPWPLADESVDVIFSSNFFEHLPSKDHLRRTLVEAHRCLRPSGALVALGPNVRRVPGRYWDFFDHHIPLTDRSLGEVLTLCGFEIVEARPSFLPYTMSGSREPPIWMLRAYLRLPFAWRFFGHQFLVVARKPS